MKLSKFKVENYGCLREVELELDNLTIIIGKNGSGKSFFLEAIDKFFSDFSTIGGGVPPGLNDYLWFRRDQSKPLKFICELYVDDEEIPDFIPLDNNILEIIKKKSNQEYNFVDIFRSLDIKNGWKTEYINWAEINIVEDDKIITPDEFNSLLQSEIKLKNYKLYFFTEGYNNENIGGPRILVDIPNKVAYNSNKQIDSLVSAKLIPFSIETQGLNYMDWCKENNYKLIERAPKQDEVPEVISLITADILQKITTSITNKIKGRFRLIPANRDIKYTPGIRTSYIEPPILDSLRTLSISTTPDDETKWDQYRRGVENFFSKRLEPNPNQLLIIEQNFRLPISHIGGGEQQILLIKQLIEKDLVIGIEEPENHFHPDLERRFFQFFKDISMNNQIILTTHSSIFVDKIDINNNWIFIKDNGETQVKRVMERDEFKLILAELGIVPSDIYLKDFVIFVEGGTEKEAVIPIFSEKLGFNIEERTAIISSGGVPRIKDFLRIWLELINYAPVNYYILLDKHSDGLVLEIIKEMGIDANKFYIHDKGSIEDYYPINLIIEAVNKLFDLEITEKDISSRKPRDKQIKNILEKSRKIRKGWKIEIGRYISQRMSDDEIPEKVIELIEHLKALQSVIESTE